MTVSRRVSPASAMHDQPPMPVERRSSYPTGETVQQLTERLEGLRRETDEVEKQLAEEDEEFNATKQSLSADRDKVKQELKDKEDKSRDIRKEVSGLERQSAQAQLKKQAKERVLRQKQSERKRMEVDIVRWTRDIETNEEGVVRMGEEESRAHASNEETLIELQSQHEQEITDNKVVEEELHHTGLRVKYLEEQRKEDQDPGTHEFDTSEEWVETEEQKLANQQMHRLHAQYVGAYSQLRQAKIVLSQSQQTLEYLQQSQSTQSHVFSPTVSLENVPIRNTSLRRRQIPQFRTFESSSSSGFPTTSAHSNPGSIASISPGFSGPPWLSLNTMALSESAPRSSLSQSEIEQLTGGAPMSPAAQDLLPAGLLGDDPPEEQQIHSLPDEKDSEDSGSPTRTGLNLGDQTLVGLNTGDRSSGVFSGDHISGGFPIGENWPGALHADDKLPGLGAIQERRASGFGAHVNRSAGVDHPHSPVSVSSRSPSVFASPRDSAPNLHQTASDNLMDSDRRSVRSTGSNRAIGGAHSRFGNLFGFGRPRTHTNPENDGPPALGTLPTTQTQSLPRHDQPTENPNEAQRRGGSRSTQILGHMSNVLSRNSARNTGEGSADSSLANLLRQRSPARPKDDTNERWPYSFAANHRPRSPRPLSTHSSELPRPTDSALINAFNPVVARQSSPLGTEWLGMTSTHSFSRHPSRRPSEQYGPSGGFPYGETLLEGDPPDIPSEPATPPQAPIGTKPSKKSQAATAKLNPAAKSFSIFSRDKKGDKVDKSEKSEKAKAKSKAKEKEATLTAEEEKEEPFNEGSPSDSRFSKDSPSIYTTDSQTDPGEALDRLDSQTPSLSHTTSENQTSSTAAKESKWHHKITRKGSASSFPHLSSLTPKGSVKSKGSGLFSSRKNNETSTPTSDATPTRDELDDDGSGVLRGGGELLDDGRSRSSGLSWSSITKRMNWKSDKAPSISEASIGSEMADEEIEVA